MNEEDPLAQLRDIALPDPIGFWPPAPGWWILFFLVIGVIAWVIIIIRRRRLKTAYRRQAIIEANHNWENFQETKNTRHYLEETARLIRRCAITAYPEQNIKHLTGPSWLAFLDSTYANEKPLAFTQGLGRDFVSLAFQSESTINGIDSEYTQSLHTLIVDWCNNHTTQKHLDTSISTKATPTTSKPKTDHETGANNASV